MPTKAFSIPTIAALLALSGASLTQAQSVYSEIQGALPATLVANSDTIISVPFASESDYSGAVASVSINGNAVTITPSGTPGWTADAYNTYYYIRFTSGAKAGMWYQVTDTATDSLVIDTTGDDLSGVLATDSFKIFKFWTLSTLFPDGELNGITASTGTSIALRKSEVMLYDETANSAPTLRCFYLSTASEWRNSASTAVNCDNVILYPESHVVIRQKAAAGTFTSTGIVETSQLTIPLNSSTLADLDIRVSNGRPIATTVANLGLIANGAFTPSTSKTVAGRKDILFIYDNSTAAYNKAPSKGVYYYNGVWYDYTNGNAVADNYVINPGEGFTIRRKKVAAANTKFWTVQAL